MLLKIFVGILCLAGLFFIACSSTGWRTASRASANLAPLPEDYKPAVVQVYRAPLWGLRGLFADHTWVSTKQEGSNFYNVYEVLGWLQFHNETAPVLRIAKDTPDRLWFGKEPEVLVDVRGEQAEGLVDKVHKAALEYPYKEEYSMVFGPNSNTFTAWIACKVPELNLELSFRAIGKNYLESCL